MKNTTTVDQLQYLFTFPFEDEKWGSKFLIAFLFSAAGFIIPVIPWVFVAGYVARIVKVVIDEDRYHLPDWEDWGNYFMEGLRLTALGFIAMLPMFLLLGVTYILMLSPMFLSVAQDSAFSYDEFSPWMFTPMIGAFAGMISVGVMILFIVLFGVLFPASMCHMIAEDKFGAAFHLRAWWPVFRANIWGFVITYILLLGTSYMTMFAFQLVYMTIVLCCLIPIIFGGLQVYLGIFAGALFGQTYRVGREKSGVDMEDDVIDEGDK